MTNNKKQKNISSESTTENNQRRDFIKKYGKLAAVTPLALTTLMSPAQAAKPGSKECHGQAEHCTPDGPGKPKGNTKKMTTQETFRSSNFTQQTSSRITSSRNRKEVSSSRDSGGF